MCRGRVQMCVPWSCTDVCAVVVYRCVPSASFSNCQSNGPVTANGCVCHDVPPVLWKSHGNGLTPDAVPCPLCTQLKGHYLHGSHVDAKVQIIL